MNLRNLTIGALMTLSLASASAQAAAHPVFGQQGQLVLGGSTSGSLSGTYYKQGSTHANQLNFRLSPQVGAFVADRFYVGGFGGVALSHANGNFAYSLAIGPQVGVAVPVSESWSFFPRIGVGYGYSPTTNRVANHQVEMDFDLSFAAHLTNGVSVTFGPAITQTVYAHNTDVRPTNYGLRLGVIGWI